jgi:signal transduction histidine kinase
VTDLLPVLDILTGLVLLVAGVLSWRGRWTSRVGPLQVLAALCWFAGSLLGPLLFLHRGPLVQLHLGYPTGRLHRRPTVAVVAVAWVAGVVEGVRPVPWLTLGVAVVVAAAAIDIYQRSSGNARQAGGPALISALLFAAALAAGSINRLLELRLDVPVAVTYDVVVMAVAVWLTTDLLTGRWSDATVAELVTQLGGEPDPRGVQAALRRALGDPTLVIGYRLLDGRYVDDDGQPVDPEPVPGQVVTTVEDDDVAVAVLVRSASAADDPDLTRAAAAAARLAVGNAALRARLRDQAVALSASRRRLVESTDRQRAAVAAALDDGADRHLARVDALLAGLDASDLRAELARARADLRDLAGGVRPRELDTAGLPDALASLTARSPVPATTDVRLRRLAPAAESALYFVCAETLTNVAKHAGATAVQVSAVERDGAAVLTVSDNGFGGALPAGSGLRGLADRVEALGGSMRVADAPAGGTVVTVMLPLAQGAHR